MNSCDHIELATGATDKARAFYSKLFQWKIEPMADGDGGEPYLMFRTDNGGGGITGKAMAEQPTAWMPYFTVASVKRSLAAAGKLGAEVIQPYMPIGEMGAIAVLRDPTGAAFGLWERSKPAAKAKPAKAKRAASSKRARR